MQLPKQAQVVIIGSSVAYWNSPLKVAHPLGVRRQSFWYESWFKLSESLAHLVNYTMLRACCDASVALRMSFV